MENTSVIRQTEIWNCFWKTELGTCSSGLNRRGTICLSIRTQFKASISDGLGSNLCTIQSMASGKGLHISVKPHTASLPAAWPRTRSIWPPTEKHLMCLEMKNMRKKIQDCWAARIIYQATMRQQYFSPKRARSPQFPDFYRPKHERSAPQEVVQVIY